MAHNTRVQLGESKFKQHRKRQRVAHVYLVGMVMLAMFGGMVALSRASFLQIMDVSVSGSHAVITSAIQRSVQQQIAGTYTYLFAKNNIFLYPKETIRMNILEQFPTLSHVKIRAENFHTVTVAVVERQPSSLWCGSTFTVTTETANCVLLTEDGLAYAPSANYSGNTYNKFYGGVASSSLPWQFLTIEQFRSLSALVNVIVKKEMIDTISGVSVDSSDDVHVVFSSGFTLVFRLHDKSNDVLERLFLVQGSLPFLSQPLSTFEYIDLRFGDKVYYKLKNK